MSSLDRQNVQKRGSSLLVKKPDEEEKPKGPVKKNDIREIRTIRQLARVNLDLDSPRIKEAMDNLGISPEELEKKERSDFEKRGVDEDVTTLRFKHFQGRLIDSINTVLTERKRICEIYKKLDNRNQTFRSNSPGVRGAVDNQGSLAQISRSPGSNMNIIPRPSQMNLQPRPSQMNLFQGQQSALATPAHEKQGGGSFMTDIKPSSRPNLNSLSPDVRKNSVEMSMSPSPIFQAMSMPTQPSSPQPNASTLVSFNFLTQVPIEEFVHQEHSKASKLSARLKSNADIKIEKELQRKIKEKEQKAHLDRVLAAADLKLKTDVKVLKERETAKKAAVDEVLFAMKREERIKLRQADKRRIEQDAELEKRVKAAQESRLQSIQKNTEKSKVKMKAVEEFKQRMLLEEAERIKERLRKHDEKLENSSARNRDCLIGKIDQVRKRNQSLSDRLTMFRTQEQMSLEQTLEEAHRKEHSTTTRMKSIYKQAYGQWQDFKTSRKEAFDYLRSRQGDNSQAIKQRNRQIMIKLKRSQKQVEDYMRNQNHELMLKQELRKLREDDISKVKMRKKRLEQSNKLSIITKEQNDEKLLKTMRDREQILIQTRHTNMMKSQHDKVAHIENLEKWVRRGFSTSRSTKKNVNLKENPNLMQLSQIAQSPIKLKNEAVEEI